MGTHVEYDQRPDVFRYQPQNRPFYLFLLWRAVCCLDLLIGSMHIFEAAMFSAISQPRLPLSARLDSNDKKQYDFELKRSHEDIV